MTAKPSLAMAAVSGSTSGGWSEQLSGWANSAKHLLGAGWAVPAAVTTAAALAAVVAVRWWLEWRALRDRVTFELVAAESFDPSVDGVVSFGKQLGRLRPAVSLVPRRGLPLRVSVLYGADGLLHHRVTVPARSVSVLRSACPAGVELRPVQLDEEPTMAAWRRANGPGQERDTGDGGLVPRGWRRARAAGRRVSRWFGGVRRAVSRRGRAARPPAPADRSAPPLPAGEADRPPRRARRVRAELVLSRPSAVPLANPGLDPDPLTAFAAAAAAISDDPAGQLEAHLDLLPITAAKARALRQGRPAFGRTAGAAAAAASSWSAKLIDPGWWSSWLEPGRAVSQPRRAPAGPGPTLSRAAGMEGLLEDRTRAKAVAGKLTSREQRWLVQVLLRSSSSHRDVAKMQLRSLLAAFDQWSGDNYWRTAGVNLGPWQLSSADRWWRRGRFDRRVNRGWFRPANSGWVTTAEIGGLLKPPTTRCGVTNVLRSVGSVPPPPRNLPVYTGIGDRHLLPVGWVKDSTGWRPAGAPKDLMLFELNLGQSGSGKSTRVEAQFIHLALNSAITGEGGMYLDPHALSLERIKPYLGPVADRILEINLSGRGTDLRQAGWNLLSMEGRGPAAVEYRVAAVVDSFASALGWTDQNNRAKTLTQMSAQALCELNLRLPPDRQATIFQMATILADKEWREAVLPYLSRHTQAFFETRFDRLAADAITPVTNLLDRLRASSAVAALFGSPRSTYDARTAMDTGQIVLACTSGTGDKDRLINCFFLYDVMQACLSRANVPEAQRRLFWLCGDELQEIDRAGIVARMLEQLRKFGLRMAGATQALTRLSDATVTSWLTNWSALIAGNVDDDVARKLTAAWDTGQSAKLKTAALKSLPAWHALASVTLPALSRSEAPRRSAPFLTRTFRTDDLYAEHLDPNAAARIHAAVDVNLARRPITETLAALDTLDDDILLALTTARRGPDPHPTRRHHDPRDDPAGPPPVQPQQLDPPIPAAPPPAELPANVMFLHAGRRRRRPTPNTAPAPAAPTVDAPPPAGRGARTD